LCAALQSLHEGQPARIYTDLKPENILRLPDGRYKLIDFGAVRRAHDIPAVTFITPGFGAPELYRGGRVTPAADLYSLGAVLYFVLTRTVPPLAGPADFGAFDAAIAPPLKELILQLLSPDPAARGMENGEWKMENGKSNFQFPISNFQFPIVAVAAHLREIRRWLRESPGFKPCPACGARIYGGSNFCAQCGRALTRRLTVRLPELRTLEEYLAEGRKELEQGRVTNALWYLETAQAQGLHTPELPLLLGEAYLSQQRFDRAIETLRQAASQGGEEIGKLGNWATGPNCRIAELPNCPSLTTPPPGQRLLLLGRAYLGARRLAEAEKVLQAATRQQPDDPAARLWLARAAMAQRKLDLAREQLEVVRIRLAPDEAEVHRLGGLCAYLGGDFDAAGASLREAMRLAPEDSQAPLSLARIEAERGRLEAAVDTLRAFCEVHPEAVEAAAQLADLYLRQGAVVQAEAWYQRILERQPFAAGPLLKLGLLYYDGHQWTPALDYLERVSGELEAEARFYRAECLRELGRLREARRLYEEHLAQQDEARAWLGLSLCHLREGELAPALRCARQVLRLSPDHARAQQIVAELPARLRRQRGGV
jgi:tetratricopeptide (TPR) repeat protein